MRIVCEVLGWFFLVNLACAVLNGFVIWRNEPKLPAGSMSHDMHNCSIRAAGYAIAAALLFMAAK